MCMEWVWPISSVLDEKGVANICDAYNVYIVLVSHSHFSTKAALLVRLALDQD